jgi:hypothetical protein
MNAPTRSRKEAGVFVALRTAFEKAESSKSDLVWVNAA